MLQCLSLWEYILSCLNKMHQLQSKYTFIHLNTICWQTHISGLCWCSQHKLFFLTLAFLHISKSCPYLALAHIPYLWKENRQYIIPSNEFVNVFTTNPKYGSLCCHIEGKTGGALPCSQSKVHEYPGLLFFLLHFPSSLPFYPFGCRGRYTFLFLLFCSSISHLIIICLSLPLLPPFFQLGDFILKGLCLNKACLIGVY